MGATVTTTVEGAVATISIDDGKVNALSPAVLAALHGALDEAEAAAALVVLTGRPGVLSAGFDLGALRGGDPGALGMLTAGYRLAERMLSFPRPVVVACTGHALAMGSFLLCAADHRIGVGGPYRIGANEVAIGLTMPRAAAALVHQRVGPAHYTRAVVLAEVFDPAGAAEAGFLDEVVPPDDLAAATRAVVDRLLALDPTAHRLTKLRVRAAALAALAEAIEADDAELRSWAATG